MKNKLSVILGLLLITVLLFAQTHTGALLDVAQTWTAAQTFNGGTFIYNLVQTSGSPYTLLGISGTYWNNTAGAYTFQLDAPVSGKQYCYGNYQTRTGAITIKSTTSVTIYYKGIASTTGTSGALTS